VVEYRTTNYKGRLQILVFVPWEHFGILDLGL